MIILRDGICPERVVPISSYYLHWGDEKMKRQSRSSRDRVLARLCVVTWGIESHGSKVM